MKNLILDCSCGMNIYVVCDDKVYSKTDLAQNKHTDNVLFVVDELLKQANLKIGDIKNIGVCIGPGSFTGVRVAISIAKGLCSGTNAKIFVLSNFDIFMDSKIKNAYYVLDGFSNFVYVRTALNGKNLDECLTIDDFKNKFEINKFDVCVTNEKTQNLLNKFEIQSNIVKNNTVDAFNCAIKNDKTIGLNQIEPIYLRASQAELERQKKI